MHKLLYHLLIVHEDAATRNRYAELLAQAQSGPASWQYQVITVSSMAAGQVLATRQHFHLVLLAFQRDNNALDLVRVLQEITPRTRLLLLCDHSVTTEQRDEAQALGLPMLLADPSNEQLVAAIAQALGQNLPAPRRTTAARTRLVSLSAEHLHELRACLVQLGKQGGVSCALLADLNGQDIVHWNAFGDIDTASVAALAAGDLLATLEINQLLMGQQGCKLIVQEHEDQHILMGRVGEHHLLLMATSTDVPLGWVRLNLKRTSERILEILDSATLTLPQTVSSTFALDVARQIERIW